MAERGNQRTDEERAERRQTLVDDRFRLDVAEAKPVAQVAAIWRSAAQVATIGIFVLLVITALALGRSLLLPVTSSFVVGMMLGPLSTWARRRGIPTVLTAIVLWFLVIGIFYGVINLLAAPAIDWARQAPQIGANIKEKLHVLDQPIARLRELRNTIFPQSGQAGLGLNVVSLVQPVFSVVTPAIGQVLMFFGTLFFVLLGRARLRAVIVAFFDEREARLRMLRILNDIERNLTTYLSVVAVINLAVGVIAGVIAASVGLPNGIAWGVLAFILNFIPYIGALIMEGALLAVGLVTFPTLTHALIAPAVFLFFATLEGQFVTPSILGRRLTLNPLTVFLALLFWAWLWGPVGAFLAVPLLIVALVVGHHLFPKEEATLPG